MEPQEAQHLAMRYMEQHGLIDDGWTFKFDHAKRRFGQCNYSKQVISLSWHLTKLNGRPEVVDTILHEIAHAKAGPHAKHGQSWKAWCIRVGARPVACYAASEVTTPKPNYEGFCNSCGKVVSSRHRIRVETFNRACTNCCKKYNNGKWSPRFVLTWRSTTTKPPKPKPKTTDWDSIPTIEELSKWSSH